eukprot:4183244-Pyramimonas_sp.AAC.1
MASMLAECNQWRPGDFDGVAAFTCHVQGVARSTWALSQQYINIFDALPYLIGRLGQPGIRDRALVQYASADPAHHHPLTNLVLGAGTHLRAA